MIPVALGFSLVYGAVLIQSHFIAGVLVFGLAVAGIFARIAWILLR